MRTSPTLVLCALALATLGGVLAEDFAIDWRIMDYEDIMAKVGDNLIFTYQPPHTVNQVNDFMCDFSGATLLGGPTSSPVTVPLEEEGTFFYACDVPGHCPQGMLLRVIVSASDDGGTMGGTADEGNTIGVGGDDGWRVMAYDDIEAQVGDTLVFNYPNGGHTVWQVNDRECNFDGGVEVGGLDDSPVMVDLDDPGMLFFACNVPGHCPAGMLFSVTVREASDAQSPSSG